ncbi:MAG: 30S ribosomal protein S9 [Chloroflexota bacterium]
MEKRSYVHGTGRRKTAVAQVKLLPGEGAILINGVPYEELYNRLDHRQRILQPFIVADVAGKYNAVVKVDGGGTSGQAGAVAHGIARALVALNESFKAPLRQSGLLTRDPRGKERKKPGLKRARKAKQYTKR